MDKKIGVVEWCAALDALANDGTLTRLERAEVLGTKRAVERRGFKMAKQASGCPFKPVPPGGINGA